MTDQTIQQLPPQSQGTLVRAADVSYRDVAPVTHIIDKAPESGLAEYWKVVVRHRGTVALVCVLGGAVGFLLTLPQTPVYRAHTTMEVQGVNDNFLNFKDVNPTTAGGLDPSNDILTQVKLIESQSLRERVIDKMKQHPPVIEMTLGNDRLTAWKKALRLHSGEPPKWDAALGMAAGSLAVRASGTTRIIDISSESTDPAVAAEFANTLVNEFIEQDLESRLTSTGRTSEWLSRQLDDLKIKLEKSEDQLQAYAAAVGLQLAGAESKTGERENIANSKLKELQTEMLSAEGERVKTQSRYELISSAPVDSLPQVLDDKSLQTYQEKLADLRRQRAELATTFTPGNPKVLRVQAQIDEVESALKRERSNVVSRIKNEYEAAVRRETLLANDYNAQFKLVNGQAGKTIHYDILKREADTNHQIYEAMLQKVKEAGIASAMRSSNYRIIDPAKAPGGPYKPNVTQSSMMGTLGGFILGVLFVLVRERADRSLQQPGDAAHFLNVPELGVIPSDTAGSAARLYSGRESSTSIIPSASDFEDVALATFKRRPSLLAESFHDTLTSILFSGQNGIQARVIALTSASPSEGKTTVTANLAAALADINQRVLLIDADMRRPRMHHVFAVSNDEGLSTLLKDQAPISSRPGSPIVVETEVPGLCVMTSGPAVSNASNLLYSPRFAELLRAARSDFDYILIDTPPMLQIADARIIAQQCDTVIMVVRAGKTTRDAAKAARQKFLQDGTPVLGVILNDWIPGQNGYGYDSKYYDRYAKYYSVKRD